MQIAGETIIPRGGAVGMIWLIEKIDRFGLVSNPSDGWMTLYTEIHTDK